MKKGAAIFLTAAVSFSLLLWNARTAEATQLFNIRFGQHAGFSRLVLDSAGARPLSIGPAENKGLPVSFETLEVAGDPARVFREMNGAVARVSLDRQDGKAVVAVIFKRPETAVKSFYMPGDPSVSGSYRLVLDFYPPGSALSGPGAPVPIVTAAAAATPVVKTAAPSAAAVSTAAASAVPATSQTAPLPEKTEKTMQVAAETGTTPPAAATTASSDPAESPADKESAPGEVTGEVSLIARPVISGEDESAKFTEYRDFNTVTGEWSLRYDTYESYFFQTDAENVAQDDQYYHLGGGRYGIFKFGASYDEIPHRYAFDVRTLYSGIGSENLTLEDGLQSALQGGAPAAATLSGAYAGAASGDPEFTRKKLSLDMDLAALDPFSFRAEFGREKQEGTRPRFGSFELSPAIELFEPIDSETIDVKLIAEYARQTFLLNATYYFQNFDNQVDTLTFDNPFRLVDDPLLGPAKGQIDLAPDNYYQNIAFSGSYMDLPFKSRLSATAAWGWMRQDDDLVPFTVNSTLTAPVNYANPASLPVKSADARVDTSLYNVTLASKPLPFMHLKGGFRHYDYDNNTRVVTFPNGYVYTDIFAVTDPISTQPSSYKKTKADVDLGFDVWTATRLNLNYAYNLTKRTNREVDRQADNIFGGSLDTSPADWLSFRASYERTETDIDDYNFDVYLESGRDLFQLPLLRKYTQADASKDRYRLAANIFPVDALAFGGSFTYGKDDYSDSPYGLTDDTYYSFSLDTDYALTDRLHFNAFYVYENYSNEQKARGGFDEDNDGIESPTDWKAEGRDVINTIGFGVKYVLVPDRLNLDLSYSYSKADGQIDFSIPNGTVDDFNLVDETKLHTLNTKLSYNIFKGYFLTFGYYWEKFDYADVNKEGFVFVPTDAGGAFNGALLSDTLPDDYDAHIFYTKFTIKF